MKIVTLILSTFLICLSLSSYAQKAASRVETYQQPGLAPVKGYYSIGNNAAKLNTPATGQVFSGLKISSKKTAPEAQKGYYATGNNNKKLTRQITFEEVQPSGQTKYKAKPTKGYYSIGRNADKLK